MERGKAGCACIEYDAEGLKLGWSSPFSRQTPILISGLQKISYEFSRFVNITLLLWVHASLADPFLLCPWQKHPTAPLFCSLGQLPCPHLNALFPLSPAALQSAPSPRLRCGVHTRWAVSGCNFKWPCAQNKCRHSAMLKNRKSLNACYRNFFCVLVVKFRAVLNIYWVSVNTPECIQLDFSKPL